MRICTSCLILVGTDEDTGTEPGGDFPQPAARGQWPGVQPQISPTPELALWVCCPPPSALPAWPGGQAGSSLRQPGVEPCCSLTSPLGNEVRLQGLVLVMLEQAARPEASHSHADRTC